MRMKLLSFLHTVSFIVTISLSREIDKGTRAKPHYLPPPVTDCYLQYTLPIYTITNGLLPSDKMVEILENKTFPFCLCEKIENKNLKLDAYEEDDEKCKSQESIPSINCDSFTGCIEEVWIGSVTDLPASDDLFKKQAPYLLGCKTQNTEYSVEVTKIDNFDIGTRCDTEAILTLLNDGIEQYRNGSLFYNKIWVSRKRLEHLCDPQLFEEGTAMEIHYKCSTKGPIRSKAKHCVSQCYSRNAAACSGNICEICDPDTNFVTMEAGLQDCLKETGLYMFWSQTDWQALGVCGLDPNNIRPWNLRLFFYTAGHAGGSTADELAAHPNAVPGSAAMAVLINRLTAITAAHNYHEGLKNTGPGFITVVSGGGPDVGENLKQGRYSGGSFFSQEMYVKSVTHFYDMSILHLEKPIDDAVPACMPLNSDDTEILDLSTLSISSWGNTYELGHKPMLYKTPTIVSRPLPHNVWWKLWWKGTFVLDMQVNDHMICKGDSGHGLVESVINSQGSNIFQLIGMGVIMIPDRKGQEFNEKTQCFENPKNDYALYMDIRYYKHHICYLTFNTCGGYYIE